MAKRRTKEEKRRALQRRQERVVAQGIKNISENVQVRSTTQQSVESIATSRNNTASDLAAVLAQAKNSAIANSNNDTQLQRFFGFNPQLLYRDLARTIMISAVILILLVVFSRLSF